MLPRLLVFPLINLIPWTKGPGVDRLEQGCADRIEAGRQREMFTPAAIKKTRQPVAGYAAIGRAVGAEISKVYGRRPVGIFFVKPVLESGEIHAPVERTVDELGITFRRAARERTEISEKVWRYPNRLDDEVEAQCRNQGAHPRARHRPQQGNGTGKHVTRGIERKNVTM